MFDQSQGNGKKVEKVSQERRHLLKRGGLLAGIAAFASAFSITPFAPGYAKAGSQPSPLKYTPLSYNDAKTYLGTVMASSNYQTFKNQIQSTYKGVFTIQEQKASAFRVETTQTTFVQVIIPVTGGAGPRFPSFYTATFQSDPHTISSEYSGLMTQKSAQVVHIAIKEYSGAMVIDADKDVTSGSLQGTVQTPQGSIPLKNGVSGSSVKLSDQGTDMDSWLACMEKCASGRGANSSLIVDLLAICGAACPKVEPICPACQALAGPIIGLAAFYDVIYCLGFCS